MGELGVVGDVRGKGLMIGIELVGSDGFTPNASAAVAALEACKQRGLLIGKGGLHGNCLRIAPPMSLTDEECAQGTAMLIDALRAVDADQGAR